MVQRTPGRFPYFQDEHNGVNGDTIRADAEDPGLHANTIGALSSQLEGDAKKVGGQLSGDITEQVQQNPSQVAGNARDLAAKGWFAVGLVNEFALRVDMFDTTTNTCNVNYNGLVAAAKKDHPKDQAAYDKAVDAAFREWNPTYQDAVRMLDDDTDTIAVAFKNPGDLEKIREASWAG